MNPTAEERARQIGELTIQMQSCQNGARSCKAEVQRQLQNWRVGLEALEADPFQAVLTLRETLSAVNPNLLIETLATQKVYEDKFKRLEAQRRELLGT